MSLVAAFALTTSAWAQTCENTFTGEVDFEWTRGDNWELDHEPTSTEVACIPAGETAKLSQNSSGNGVCEALVISSGGTVIVDVPRTLTVHADSRIDGIIWFTNTSKLIIADDITISGNGGVLDSAHPFGGNSIESVGGAHTLTLQGDDNDARSTSLVLRGAGDVDVSVVNNAYVVANWPTPIAFNEGPISGNGFWICEERHDGAGNSFGGNLVFNAAVSGSAEWIIFDGPDSKIQINVASTTLTGDVTISAGVLDVNENFKTTGDLTLESVSGSAPSIEVAGGRTAEFDAAP